MKRFFLSLFFTLFLTPAFTGCDAIYGYLQKEGAEERVILGELIPFQENLKVKELQKLLKLYGYNPGSVDGKFGPNTRKAIARFQEDNGLEVTRFVDEPTWDELHRFYNKGLVVNGELNFKKVQTALRYAGLYNGTIDGKMGTQSKIALYQFQQQNALQTDGRIGFKTLSKLAHHLPEPQHSSSVAEASE